MAYAANNNAVSDAEAFQLIEGDYGQGKTAALTHRALALLDEGVPAQSIAVFCATKPAAQEFRQHLCEADGRAVALVVTTVPAFALALIRATQAGAPAVQVALPVELKCLQADLLVRGYARASVALAVAHPQAAARGDADNQAAARAARETLAAWGLVHADDLAPLAKACVQRTLRQVAGQAGLAAVPYGLDETRVPATPDSVLVDDADTLSAAELELLAALPVQRGAATCLAVAPGEGDTPADAPLALVHAWAHGGRVARVTAADADAGSAPAKNTRILSFVRAMETGSSDAYDQAVSDGRISLEDTSVQLIKWHTPEHELRSVAALVRHERELDPGLEQHTIYLAAPNVSWTRAACGVLRENKFACVAAFSHVPLSCAARAAEERGLYDAFARLSLMAYPDSLHSWRLWLARGARDAGAALWAELEGAAGRAQIAVPVAAQALAEGETLPAQDCAPIQLSDELITRMQEARSYLQRAKLTGYSLLQTCCPEENALLQDVIGSPETESCARDLADTFRETCVFPTFRDEPGAIRVGPIALARGLHPQLIVVLGAVEGLVPSFRCYAETLTPAAREQACELERAEFLAALSGAGRRVIVSAIQEAPEDSAKALKLQVARYKMEGGQRMAMLKRVPFVAAAQNAAPGWMSAEQYLMD